MRQYRMHCSEIAGGQPEPAEALKNRSRKQGPLSRILIRDGEKVHVIPVETVSHIESQDDYVEIHAGGKKYIEAAAAGGAGDIARPASFYSHSPLDHCQRRNASHA